MNIVRVDLVSNTCISTAQEVWDTLYKKFDRIQPVNSLSAGKLNGENAAMQNHVRLLKSTWKCPKMKKIALTRLNWFMVPDIIPLEASIALAWISKTTWIDKFQYKHPYNVIMHLHQQKIGKEKSTMPSSNRLWLSTSPWMSAVNCTIASNHLSTLPTNYSISRQARLWINKDN